MIEALAAVAEKAGEVIAEKGAELASKAGEAIEAKSAEKTASNAFDPRKPLEPLKGEQPYPNKFEFDPKKPIDVKDNQTSNKEVTNSAKFDEEKHKSDCENSNDLKIESQSFSTPNESLENETYQGGSYGEVKKHNDTEKKEVHHMPADSVSHLERNDGPAISMDAEDHRQTASCGNSKEAREYRAKQKELIDNGKFREAFEMDVDDIKSKFGNKYDHAISEARAYIDQLEQGGKI